MDKTALVVDDTSANRDFLERFLTQAGFNVRGASTGKGALALVEGIDDLALALIDMQLPDVNGLHLTYELRRRYPQAYLVVATMHDERSLMESVFIKGGNCFLVKPHGFMELYKRLTTMELADLCAGECVVMDQYGPRNFILASR